MSFDVSADDYRRFMGRFSEPLAARFADLSEVRRGQRALDVGCGPGALTAELVRRLGAGAVCAVEPSASFAAAVARRLPGVAVLIRLRKVSGKARREAITDGWLACAPPSLADQFLKR